jgi:hypothetical protein
MDSLPYKDVTIGGQAFRMSLLGSVQGRTLLLRLTKSLGPVIGGLDLDEDDPVRALTSGGAGFLSTLDERLFQDLCAAFGASNHVMGTGGLGATVAVLENTLFAGKYLLLLEWLYANLEYNFTDFLGENGPVRKKLTALLQSAFKSSKMAATTKQPSAPSADPTGPTSPTTSTGTSAAS